MMPEDSGKRPSFQFYPADWLRDPALRRCSPSARSLWIDLLCHMHFGTPYGHFQFGPDVIPRACVEREIAKVVGSDIRRIRRDLSELVVNHVCSFSATGSLYSRRMVRDFAAYQAKVENGRKYGKIGGNPAFIKGHSNPYYDKGGDKGHPYLDPYVSDKAEIRHEINSSSSSSLNLRKKERLRGAVDIVDNHASAPRKSASPSPPSPLGLAQEPGEDSEETNQDADRSIGTDLSDDIEELIKNIGTRMTMPNSGMA